MSATSIIVAIICLLGILISYAFVQQTVKTKRERRARLIAALKSRVRNFKFMLNGFPKGFLPKELTLLVQRSLADVCEQLSTLEPTEPQHLREFQSVSAQLSESQKQPGQKQVPPLSDHRQIKDVKACLEELHKFVYRLEEKATLTKNQAKLYRNQIKDLVLQAAVDSYCLNGSQAEQSGKAKLAIHYFELALKLIVREGKTELFKNKLTKLDQSIAELTEQLSEQDSADAARPQGQDEQAGVEEEWSKFSQEQEAAFWKKKKVYD